MKILMVCLGNICRSPLAEGILRHLSAEKELDWEVDSAGTGSWHIGQPPDNRSVEVARKNGLDITSQRARQFHFPDFEAFDVIYAMDTSNYDDILQKAESEEERNKVKLILDELQHGGNLSVPDPYWDDDGFDKVYNLLEEACTAIVERYN
jgi:protein-tyrosine phosphatase